MDIINYNLHIPRPSLSSGSHSVHSSTDSIKTYNDRTSDGYGRTNHHHKIRRTFGSCDEGPSSMASLTSATSCTFNNKNEKRKNSAGKVHRGSRSSQGSSSDGLHSLHVGSLYFY
jgi:hypothetical protein